MISYEELTKYLVKVGKRHPNIQLVKFDTDVSVINSSSFVCPALIISPAPLNLDNNSVVQYSFQLLYLDKLNQEETNYTSILEYGFQTILQYISVIELEYKIVKGITIDPVLEGYEGGLLIGVQTTIQIEDHYNVTRNKNLFYE